jgi:uncharacterized membrane protein YhiD involved in acid resistance
MASTALTVFTGVSGAWFGHSDTTTAAETTRVVQGIVTGIGFLGAGVIVRNGTNVTGLATAASIWAASAIGVLVGVGFYGAAIVLAVLCMLAMTWLQRVEQRLPGVRVFDLGASERRSVFAIRCARAEHCRCARQRWVADAARGGRHLSRASDGDGYRGAERRRQNCSGPGEHGDGYGRDCEGRQMTDDHGDTPQG